MKEFKSLTKKELFLYHFETAHEYSLCQESYYMALKGLQNFQIIFEDRISDADKIKLCNENIDIVYQEISNIHDEIESGKAEKLLKYMDMIGYH